MRGNYKSLKGTNLTVVEGMHQYHVYPVRRTKFVRKRSSG